MKQYRKKPVVIEAVQWNGDNFQDIIDMSGKGTVEKIIHSDVILIHTLEGNMTAMLGDYIIKGIKGECYPCKPDIFEETYEEV